MSIFTNSAYIPNGGIAYNYPITAKPITKVSSSNITTEVVGNFTFPPLYPSGKKIKIIFYMHNFLI